MLAMGRWLGGQLVCFAREPGYGPENRGGFTVGSLRKAPGTIERWSSGSLNYPSCAYWKDTGRTRPQRMKPRTSNIS
ncbi:MAG: hypothetical protein QOD59_2749 [Mycobacterium sp.]|jgi:hypothetical protein|nr:hypothetical protein [Mycobacterium sp.]